MNNTENRVDLHIHTTYSDGIFSPDEAVKNAVRLGLRAIAITDHDNVGGILPSVKTALETELEIIPGLELSSRKGDREIHLLGYFIDWQNEKLLKFLEKLKNNRDERMKKMLELLKKRNINISFEKNFSQDFKGTIGRLHLARVMVKETLVKTIKEAFDRYIGDGKSCCVEHACIDYDEAIALIRHAGGVAVLAHPGSAEKEENIFEYVQAGLKGIEVFHSKHSYSHKGMYKSLAEKYNLIITGGSDCHGSKTAGKILMGSVTVGYETVEQLRAAGG